MKNKIIGIIAFAAIAVAAGWGYIQNKQDVVLSDLALENIDALANGEISDGGITGECFTSVVFLSECKVTCICGTTWYPTPRVSQAAARNVKGTCSKCGNSSWNSYNQ